jgi:lipid-binding SYLF domain-containing protein
MNMKKGAILAFILVWLLFLFAMAAVAGWDPLEHEKEKAAVEKTITKFKEADPSMKVFFEKAYGYAVFPGIGQGGFIIGGGHGYGWVYEKGIHVGVATVTDLSVGAQIGGQSFAEVIFFADKSTFDDFKKGDWQLGAQASAVLVKQGASKDATYNNGVAVFTMPNRGLMAKASVGGQTFKYTPK